MAERMACAATDANADPQGISLGAVHSYAGGDPIVGGGSCGGSAQRCLDDRRTGSLCLDPGTRRLRGGRSPLLRFC